MQAAITMHVYAYNMQPHKCIHTNMEKPHVATQMHTHRYMLPHKCTHTHTHTHMNTMTQMHTHKYRNVQLHTQIITNSKGIQVLNNNNRYARMKKWKNTFSSQVYYSKLHSLVTSVVTTTHLSVTLDGMYTLLSSEITDQQMTKPVPLGMVRYVCMYVHNIVQ